MIANSPLDAFPQAPKLGSVITPRQNPNDPIGDSSGKVASNPRAKLKVFFGMAPGVGKTYAMLQDGQNRRSEGLDVVIGRIETHGRADTLALAADLETLPLRALPLHGQTVEEFDLQAAFQRKPHLILLDDLAHANVQGSIHEKRWQDVWDLLDAGINVYTTLNVQHIESLKDVVAQITGLIVRDTIPDTILQRADEIELVDLSPEELIQRLSEGKVFVPEQARHTVERFFRKGNLLALRELSLRRTADHVDADMRRYMSTEGIARTWAVNERLLVCISPAPESASLIRATQRLAERIKAPWLAAYVETTRIRHSGKDRDQIEEHLRLVERLGGETLVLQGDLNLAEDLVQVAVARNVTRILVGKPGGPPWLRLLRPSLIDRLVRICGSIDVMVVARAANIENPAPQHIPNRPRNFPPILHFLWAALVITLATGIGWLMQVRRFELADIVMIYVLGILIVGVRYGRWPAIEAAILSLGAFDFFFVPPTHSFQVADPKHSSTFVVLLIAGIVIGNLTERIRAQMRLARVREQRTLALFKLSAELTQSGGSATMVESVIRSVASQFQSRASILLPDTNGHLSTQGNNHQAFTDKEIAAAQWVYDHQEAAGLGTDTLPGAQALNLPLHGSKGIIGVMAVQPEGVPKWTEPDQRHLLEAFANQAALALERALLVEKGVKVQQQADVDHLRNTLLSSVSHDLCSPLATILNAASTLLEKGEIASNADHREQAKIIHDEAQRLQRLISNLLDVTRLESGQMIVKKKGIPARQLIDSALERANRALNGHDVKLEIPPNLPLIPADPLLMEQVLVHLLENAAHFSPKGQPIEFRVWATDRSITLAVMDQGSGLPTGLEEKIFEKLVRASNTQGETGGGLGLTICKGIVEAHGGWIQGSNRAQGGAQFLVCLPLEASPPGER